MPVASYQNAQAGTGSVTQTLVRAAYTSYAETQGVWSFSITAAIPAGGSVTVNGVTCPIGDINPFRFCGEYFDTETGTVYLRARMYNPLTGRFTSEDPIRSGLNWYTYCSNNPIFYIDPWGLEEVWIREFVYQLGGTVHWYDSVYGAIVSFGSAGWKFYSGYDYRIENGMMYVDDQEFLNEWGIVDSINRYYYFGDDICRSTDGNPLANGYATFTIFRKETTGLFGITSYTYYERFSIAGQEVYYDKTSLRTYDVKGGLFSKDSRMRVDIHFVSSAEISYYNGYANYEAREAASVVADGLWLKKPVIAFLLSIYSISPVDKSVQAGLQSGDIRIRKVGGTNTVDYFFRSSIGKIVYQENNIPQKFR